MIRGDLARFDGRSVSVLEGILRDHDPPTAALIDELLDALKDDETLVQAGASWLLREILARGCALGDAQFDRLAGSLEHIDDGFGRLHLCQALRHLRVSERHAESFAVFLRECLSSDNTFLRAWAPDGLFRLAEQHERFLGEATAAVEAALSDPAASVRARARRTLRGE